ncbi:MAG TPA: deoxyuridine 5'-triphosphate nucleotidohydrolase, partial [Thermoprotei archaeon]|nr:deoxyuridine 5'-triphosphate nucleotidohydrolase [Thermoprotei archaeon]
ATVETAVWDPGYRGRSYSLLIVYNEEGIRLKRNARLVQLVFIKVMGDTGGGYKGTYQFEGLKQ